MMPGDMLQEWTETLLMAECQLDGWAMTGQQQCAER